ncbi:EamA family transporter [Propionibacteriaceae bacterium Y1700]|uniref:EamA family transporter n=1 Tax=Microlunatus sp. Y1700 TaxID=3418487 RepID=UPI003DA71E3E
MNDAQPTTPAGLTGRIPPSWLVVTSIASVQVGAAVAKDLFGTVPPTAMVWLRLITSAIVLLILIRPRLTGRTRHDWLVALGYGVSLTLMNWAIYQSFARLPLGVAVTIEFLGPLLLAVAGSRRLRDIIWVVLAGAGVALLGFEPTGLDPVGVVFALIAGAGWAAYIVLSGRTGRHWQGLSGLAVASVVGAVALAAPAVAEAGPTLLQPRVLLLGAVVGLMSSVIPYSLELVALRRMPAKVFSILMSLEPAAAALAAVLLLHELLSVQQWIAIVLVVAASIGSTRSSRPRVRDRAVAGQR